MKSTKNSTRDRLLKAAVSVSAEKGYEHFTVKQVADHAEVSEALIYKYFESRSGLVDACVLYVQQCYRQRLAELLPYLTGNAVTESIYPVWSRYVDLLIRYSENTIFSFEYITSRYSDSERLAEIDRSFSGEPAILNLRRQCAEMTDSEFAVYREVLRTVALDYAVGVIWGRIQDSDVSRRAIWHTFRHRQCAGGK